MQRYFVRAADWDGNEVIIKGDDVHHITRVMRFKEGDEIICNNAEGHAAICRIMMIDPRYIQASVSKWLDESVELPVHVTIAQGIPKGDKFDLVLQKGTELGAYSFIPFQAERSVVVWDEKKKDKKIQRFAKIVKEASEQSHRNLIPEIKQPMSIEDLLKESMNYDIKLFAYEEETRTTNHQSFGSFVHKLEDQQHLLVCIGPEGGFSKEEAAVLRSNGFKAVRLGPRILRTETAALYALASISYHFEELRCNR